MCAKKVEELMVYQKALDLAVEISAILNRPGFHRNWRLREQLGDSSEAVPSLISDGFAQSTDRFFAQLLYRAKGESSETRTHLRIARVRGCITGEELVRLCERYEEVEKMATGLIRHPERENRRHRG